MKQNCRLSSKNTKEMGVKMARKKKDRIFRVGVINGEKEPKVKEITKELEGIFNNFEESILNSFDTTEKENNIKK
ncbi:hypothetical protein CHI12_05280 [Terribacillus saccharophilus]|uniref:Uncharacterized protein n=2 Tax=Bacillaceae TaxID=186817 RepID=A0A268HFH4_9BACI|nr:hypothetical protein CHI12_05280 [Terribacillus saccharophilus]